MKKPTGDPIPSSQITSESAYMNRRSFIKSAGLAMAAPGLALGAAGLSLGLTGAGAHRGFGISTKSTSTSIFSAIHSPRAMGPNRSEAWCPAAT